MDNLNWSDFDEMPAPYPLVIQLKNIAAQPLLVCAKCHDSRALFNYLWEKEEFVFIRCINCLQKQHFHRRNYQWRKSQRKNTDRGVPHGY